MSSFGLIGSGRGRNEAEEVEVEEGDVVVEVGVVVLMMAEQPDLETVDGVRGVEG